MRPVVAVVMTLVVGVVVVVVVAAAAAVVVLVVVLVVMTTAMMMLARAAVPHRHVEWLGLGIHIDRRPEHLHVGHWNDAFLGKTDEDTVSTRQRGRARAGRALFASARC